MSSTTLWTATGLEARLQARVDYMRTHYRVTGEPTITPTEDGEMLRIEWDIDGTRIDGSELTLTTHVPTHQRAGAHDR